MSIGSSTRDQISKKKDSTFLHVRIDRDLKEDLLKYANQEKTSVTAIITNLVEGLLYKTSEMDEEDKEEELLDLIITSLSNLEKRMEIRLGTLQDTFNSLIGRLIDSQAEMAQRRAKRLSDDEELEMIDFSDILETDKEEEIYVRVKRFLNQRGEIVDLQTVISHIEIDRSLKKYLDEQNANIPGWKEALITDAIQEAVQELGLIESK